MHFFSIFVRLLTSFFWYLALFMVLLYNTHIIFDVTNLTKNYFEKEKLQVLLSIANMVIMQYYIFFLVDIIILALSLHVPNSNFYYRLIGISKYL